MVCEDPIVHHTERKMIIPEQIQIETVAGLCNVSCNMCPIDSHPRQEIMSLDFFKRIIKRLKSYSGEIKMVTLSGIGEPFLDKSISLKISYLVESGFQGVGVYTNGMALTPSNTEKVFEAGLSTLVISLDGLTAETQDRIRLGSEINKLLPKIHNAIKLRDSRFKNVSIILRFTRQAINSHETETYVNYWREHLKLATTGRDQILIYDMHSHGNLVDIKNIQVKQIMRQGGAF